VPQCDAHLIGSTLSNSSEAYAWQPLSRSSNYLPAVSGLSQMTDVMPLSHVSTILLGPFNVGKSTILKCMITPPPGLFERNFMEERRTRTRYPVIMPYEHEPDGTAARLHVRFTDPPGTVTLAFVIKPHQILNGMTSSLSGVCVCPQVTPNWLQWCSFSCSPRPRCSWW